MPVINLVAPGAIFPDGEGPCSWALETACCPDWDTTDANTRALGTAWATYLLWALTGRRYGPCSVKLRPCAQKCDVFQGYMTWPVGNPGSSGAGMPWMIPFVDNGTWRNCGCAGVCSCRARCEIPLPGPVARVDEVLIDGAVLDPGSYRVDSYRGQPVLVRTDGECWPECQDMGLADDAVGAFTVTYQRGVDVPRAGQIAAGKLACEFIKACEGGDCRLPDQLASLSRNGVEVEVADPTELLENGLTGVADVDLWIRAVNPARKAMRSRVLSGDLPAERFTRP